MTVRIDSNNYLTDEQQQVYQLRESLERNGGTPVGFLELLAAVVTDGTWQKVPSGVNQDEPFTDFAEFIEAEPPFGLGAKAENVRILLQIRHPHEGVARIREQMDTMRAEVGRLLGADPEEDPVARDARHFGAYARSGGWTFGLMVARSVRPGASTGGYRDKQDRSDRNERNGQDDQGKVSANRFAVLAGTSAPRVMRFYRAWERAATAGVVPAFDQLVPGCDVELPAAELWGEYFTKFEQSTDRRESIAQQAEAAGTSYTEAVKVAHNPAALRTAILGDAKTADAARKALVDRMEDDADLRANLARTVASDPQLKKVVANESRRVERTEYVRHVAEDGKAKTAAGRVVELPEEVKAKAVEHLAVAQDPQATPEAVAEAYEGVQRLIEATIESDPKSQADEQRARVRKVLMSTFRSIASVSEVPWADIADEEMIREVSELQESVNALAALVVPKAGSHLRAVGDKAV